MYSKVQRAAALTSWETEWSTECSGYPEAQTRELARMRFNRERSCDRNASSENRILPKAEDETRTDRRMAVPGRKNGKCCSLVWAQTGVVGGGAGQAIRSRQRWFLLSERYRVQVGKRERKERERRRGHATEKERRAQKTSARWKGWWRKSRGSWGEGLWCSHEILRRAPRRLIMPAIRGRTN